MCLNAVFFYSFRPRGQTNCKNIGFSAIVVAHIVKTDVFEQAENSGAGNQTRSRRGKRGEQQKKKKKKCWMSSASSAHKIIKLWLSNSSRFLNENIDEYERF